jgi:hypothetical protein
MPALPLRCPVLGGRALGALGEPSYRLYNCARCGAQVRVCRRCDHGNLYCARACAQIRRAESVRRASARYQRTRRGAARHAARQRAFRARERCKVTHQGSPNLELRCKVSGTGITQGIFTDVSRSADQELVQRCTFCRAVLPRWTRIRAGPWSGW